MTMFKKTLAALAGASFLVAQPAAAAGAERASSNLAAAEGQAESLPIGVIIGGILAVLVILELTEVINIIGDDDPASP